MQGVCRLLSIIYHLGCAGAITSNNSTANEFSPPQNSSSRFLNIGSAEKAAHLLGISVQMLTKDIFCSPATHAHHQSSTPDSLDLLGCFVANLYAIAVNSLKDLINRLVSALITWIGYDIYLHCTHSNNRYTVRFGYC